MKSGSKRSPPMVPQMMPYYEDKTQHPEYTFKTVSN
jgi:hypothetical protein